MAVGLECIYVGVTSGPGVERGWAAAREMEGSH